MQDLFHASVLIVLLCALVPLQNCAPPTDYDPQPAPGFQLTVRVRDTSDEPMKDVQVITYPPTATLTTDENGIAVFENMPPGEYQVVISRSDIPVFYEKIMLTWYSQIVDFTIAFEVTINLAVTDANGFPLENLSVFTSPPTMMAVTDENGRTVMKNILVKSYTFIIQRGLSTVYFPNRKILVKNGTVQDLELVIQPQFPQVFIREPASVYNDIFDMSFKAEGYDFEDGMLPSESFTWYSSVSGELGTGSEITIERMDGGHHTITLSGRDSDGNIDTASIQIKLYFSSEDTFFPIPYEGYWNYRNTPQSFSLPGEKGGEETYTLRDISVTMKDIDVREATMLYEVKDGVEKYWYRYTVDDTYINIGDGLFITRTVEQLKKWDIDPEFYAPEYINDIQTDYDTNYPFLTDYIELAENNFHFFSEANVTWSYEGPSGTLQFSDPIDIISETSFLGYETITTEAGTFETGKIKIVQGETERILWLAKGYGIVQYEYNSFGIPVVSGLADTNLDELQKQEQPLKRRDPGPEAGGAASSTADTSGLEEARARIAIFRGLAPR